MMTQKFEEIKIHCLKSIEKIIISYVMRNNFCGQIKTHYPIKNH